MNCSQFMDAGSMKSFDGSEPKFDIRIDRVFYHYRRINSFECIGNFLYRKRIDSSTCAYPQDRNISLERSFYMSGIGYFYHYRQTGDRARPT